MKKSVGIRIVVGLTITMALAACGGGGGGSSGPSLDDAWRDFEAGNYAKAAAAFADLFDNASGADAQAAALSGKGWAHAFAGDLDSAAAAFDLALGKGTALAEAQAGAAAVALARGEFADAVTHAGAALQNDAVWEFTHYAGIDANDVRLILAQAHFALGATHYPDAQAQVDALDPQNGLDPGNAGSWGGFASYAEALLNALEELEETIGADMPI